MGKKIKSITSNLLLVLILVFIFNLNYVYAHKIKDESGRGPLNFSRERGTKILAVYGKALKYSSGRVLLRIYDRYGFLRPFEMFLTMPPAESSPLINPFISVTNTVKYSEAVQDGMEGSRHF